MINIEEKKVPHQFRNKYMRRGNSGVYSMQSSASNTVDASGKLDKSIWDEYFEERTDPNGLDYLFLTKPLVMASSPTFNANESPLVPSIFSGLPIDQQTLSWVDGVLKVVGGIGGGGIESAPISGSGNAITDASLSDDGKTLTLTKGTTFLTQHQSLTGYATETWVANKGYLAATGEDKTNWNTAFKWGDHSKAEYAKASVLNDYVTLGTKQDITGAKAFTAETTAFKGITIGGVSIKKSEDGVLLLEGNLLVTGGVTFHALGSRSAATIMDGVIVDDKTIIKENGKLKVVGGGGSGISGIKLNGSTYSPDSEKFITLPDYPTLTWAGIAGKPSTLGGYGITDDVLTSANMMDKLPLFVNPFTRDINRIPYVSTDGVMEVGKYIDFHAESGSSKDYDVRLQALSSRLIMEGGVFEVTDVIYGNVYAKSNNKAAFTFNKLGLGSFGMGASTGENVWQFGKVADPNTGEWSYSYNDGSHYRFIGSKITLNDNELFHIKNFGLSTSTNTRDIVVNGDANTYYPVIIEFDNLDSKTYPNKISVWRNLGEQCASYPGNHGNGTSSMLCIYNYRAMYWDGNNGYMWTEQNRQDYARLVSDVGYLGSSQRGMVIYLRGGGTLYHVSVSSANIYLSVYYERTNVETYLPAYPVWVEPRTTMGNLGYFATGSSFTVNGLLANKVDVGYSYGSGGDFALNVSGGIYTTEYIRAVHGLYLQNSDIYFTSNNHYPEISSNGNEIVIAGGASMHVNYRSSVVSKTIPNTWEWHAGSGSNYANFVTNTLLIRSSGSNYSEGLRIERNPNGWSNIQFGTDSTLTGFVDGQWILGKKPNYHFVISPSGSQADTDLVPMKGIGIDYYSGNVHLANRVIVGARRHGGDPTIDLAIGDNDTGLNWRQDGVIDIYGNNEKIGYWNATEFYCYKNMYAQNFVVTDGYVTINGYGKYAKIGCQNASLCHYETTASGHWFNAAIFVNGNIHAYSGAREIGSYAEPFGTIYTNNWFRAKGASGLYFQDYGGGITMTDSSYVRIYGDKQLLVTNGGRASISTYGSYQGYGQDSSWNNGFAALNVPIFDNGSQTPLLLGYRVTSTPETPNARLFAIELLNSGERVRFSMSGSTRFEFLRDGIFYASGVIGVDYLQVGGGLLRYDHGNSAIYTNCNFLAHGGITMIYTSDLTLKKNPRLVIDASKRLMSLGGIYDFEYIDDEVRRNSIYAGEHTGLIYQNVKDTCMRRICHEREDGKGSINYIDTSFISLLAAVGMEHETRLQTVERQIKELERRVA